MTKQQAKETLSFHSGRNSDIDNPKWENGFLGSLRPYRGKLNEASFHEIIMCLEVLGEDLIRDTIDSNIVADIMGILHLGRVWGVYENGMLKRNNLISEKDAKTLGGWLDIISYTFMMILDTNNDAIAFEEYEHYLEYGTFD